MGKNTQLNSKTIMKIPTVGNDSTTLGINSVTTTNLQDLSVTTPKLADGAVTGPKLGTDALSLISKQLKNYIINGDMAISQRATSFVTPASGQYTLDRYSTSKAVGTSTHTVTQDTDVPTFAQVAAAHPSGLGYVFNNSMRWNQTTSQAAVTAGQYLGIFQRIEGYNYAQFAQKAFTLSFWVKATLTGTYCVSFTNTASDRSYVAEYTINATNTWEFKQIQVAAPPSAGTWNYTNGVGIAVQFQLACGTSFQTTANSWQTGQFFATANQVNGLAAGATDFRLTGIMVNEGSVAMPFRLFADNAADELKACWRYLPVFRPTVTNERLPTITASANTTSASGPIIFNVPTRVPVTSFVLSANADFRLTNPAIGNFAVTGTALAVGGSYCADVQWSAVGLTTQVVWYVYSTAGAGFIYFNGAEL